MTQGDLWTQFYEHYCKEAEEYNKDFNKRCDEDLNMAQIFTSLASPSGYMCSDLGLHRLAF